MQNLWSTEPLDSERGAIARAMRLTLGPGARGFFYAADAVCVRPTVPE